MEGLLADGDVYAFLLIVGELVGEAIDPGLDVGVLHDLGRLEHRFAAAEVAFTWQPGATTVGWRVTAAADVELAARAVARTLNGAADPGYGRPLMRPAKNDERHRDATARRWGAGLDDGQWRQEQCGRCVYWIPLTGDWGTEWGVCSCPDSPHDGRATSDQDACPAYAPTAEWVVPTD